MKKIVLLLALTLTSGHALAAKVTGKLSPQGGYCTVVKPAGCPGAGNAVPVSCGSGWVTCYYDNTCEASFACGMATGTVSSGFDEVLPLAQEKRKSFQQ